MTSLRRLATRGTLLFLAPLVFFSCSEAGSTGDESDDGDSGDCRKDADCPDGRICVGLDGNRDDACNEGESCGCIVIGTGGEGGAAGDTNGGSAGDSNGGSSTGGNATGGSGKGGSANGGSSTGGNGTGGATGGSGSAMGGSGGMQSDCETTCDRFVAAMCVATTHAACVHELRRAHHGMPRRGPDVCGLHRERCESHHLREPDDDHYGL